MKFFRVLNSTERISVLTVHDYTDNTDESNALNSHRRLLLFKVISIVWRLTLKGRGIFLNFSKKKVFLCHLRSNTGLVHPCLSLPLLNGKLDILSYLLEQGAKKNLNDIQNSRQNRSKNELVRKNAVTRAHGSCPLWVMGSCFQCKKDEHGKMNEKKWKTKIPSHVCVDHKAHGLKSWFPPEFFQIVFFLFNFFFSFLDHGPFVDGAIFIPTLPPPPFLTSHKEFNCPKSHYCSL